QAATPYGTLAPNRAFIRRRAAFSRPTRSRKPAVAGTVKVDFHHSPFPKGNFIGPFWSMAQAFSLDVDVVAADFIRG
ncbi:hypothetical protein ABTB40_21195, partial [Acinetobacter baumannii]